MPFESAAIAAIAAGASVATMLAHPAGSPIGRRIIEMEGEDPLTFRVVPITTSRPYPGVISLLIY
jgi:hypothetical protein